jgi:hypothetical protein
VSIFSLLCSANSWFPTVQVLSTCPSPSTSYASIQPDARNRIVLYFMHCFFVLYCTVLYCIALCYATDYESYNACIHCRINRNFKAISYTSYNACFLSFLFYESGFNKLNFPSSPLLSLDVLHCHLLLAFLRPCISALSLTLRRRAASYSPSTYSTEYCTFSLPLLHVLHLLLTPPRCKSISPYSPSR